MSTDYEKTWTEFWEPLVVKDGVLDMDQIKRELHDAHLMMGQASEVYMHVTGGMVSKPNTMAFEVIALADEHYAAEADADAAEATQEMREFLKRLNGAVTSSPERDKVLVLILDGELLAEYRDVVADVERESS